MEKTVEAVYENGALRPLEPLPLRERQQVTVTISDTIPPNHPLLVSPEEWAHAAHDGIGLDEVRQALSTIHGSLTEAVLDERRER